MTTIIIEFKRGNYPILNEDFMSKLKEHIELSENKPKDLSFIIKEEFD